MLKSQPSDVTAPPGSDVFFPCTYIGISANILPQWRINGELFFSNSLPPRHFYNGTGVLVLNIDESMNMNSYICLFDLTSGYYVSTTGQLLVGNNPLPQTSTGINY